MATAALLVFQEIFEMSLIIGLLVAATEHMRNRDIWFTGGCIFGCLAIALIVLSINSFNFLFSYQGQHVFNSLVFFIAALIISVVLIRAYYYVPFLINDKKSASHNTGNLLMPALAIAIMLLVLRKGIKVMFFLDEITTVGQVHPYIAAIGGILGALLAIAGGYFVYRGLLLLSHKARFTLITCLLALLIAGMAAKGAGYLIMAGWLPPLLNPIWNTSFIISQHDVLGHVLSALTGYQDQPAGIQVIFYFVTLLSIFLITRLLKNRLHSSHQF